MIEFSGDFTEANNYLNLIVKNANNLNSFLATKGKDRLKDSNKASFREQRDPSGVPWEKSVLSQTDRTGSPRFTMIRSTNLFQDTQDNANYVMNGLSLEQFTTAQSEKGFLYGYYHNTKTEKKGSGRWWFAGLDKKNLDLLTENMIDYIFKGS